MADFPPADYTLPLRNRLARGGEFPSCVGRGQGHVEANERSRRLFPKCIRNCQSTADLRGFPEIKTNLSSLIFFCIFNRHPTGPFLFRETVKSGQNSRSHRAFSNALAKGNPSPYDKIK